jgi:hypothetical protein
MNSVEYTSNHPFFDIIHKFKVISSDAIGDMPILLVSREQYDKLHKAGLIDERDKELFPDNEKEKKP